MANITITASRVSATRIQIDAVSEVPLGSWAYSINGGDYIPWMQDQATSCSIVLTGLKPSTFYTIQVRAREKLTWGLSNTLSLTTVGATSIVNVDRIQLDSQSPTVQISTYCEDSDFYHELTIGNGFDSIMFMGLKFPTGMNRTAIPLDEGQVEVLLGILADKSEEVVNCTLSTRVSEIGRMLGEFSYDTDVFITEENFAPVVGDFTVEDINPDTIALTGDPSLIVSGVSEVKVTFPGAYVAHGAEIVEYSATVGNETKSIRAGGSPPYYIVFDTVTPPSSGLVDVTVAATDSRGFVGRGVRQVQVLPYSRVELTTWDMRRVNNAETVALLAISGEYSPLVVGGVAKNTRVYLDWRYRKTTDTGWSGWQTVTTNTASGTFGYASSSFGSFEQAYSYQIQFRVRDALSESSIYTTLPKALPLVSYRDGKVGINNPAPTSAFDVLGQIRQNGTGVLGLMKQVDTGFNNITEGGIYWYSTSKTQANAPQSANGVLLVIPADIYVSQVFFSANRVCVRLKTNNSWSSWTTK